MRSRVRRVSSPTIFNVLYILESPTASDVPLRVFYQCYAVIEAVHSVDRCRQSVMTTFEKSYGKV
jgi:hypothetical protein